MEELQQLATATLCGRLHTYLKSLVEECGGTYMWTPRKSYERCVQKVEQDCEGDFSRLLDVERATGLFEQAEDMLLCLRRVSRGGGQGEGRAGQESSSSVVVHVPSSVDSPTSSSSSVTPPSPRGLLPFRVLRCKDRLNSPLASGYRDILLNVCDVESGFVAELQLNFHKIAQIKSQSHRFYELIRVMDIKWA